MNGGISLDSAVGLEDLKRLQTNRFEALSDDRKGQFGIRINLQWRVCFV
jgi:toxin HigB-1